jgi:hypothetical protein
VNSTGYAPGHQTAAWKTTTMNAKHVKPKRVALYVRVSTSEQNTRNQRRELKAVAERHGWQVVTFTRTRASPGSRAATTAQGSRSC